METITSLVIGAFLPYFIARLKKIGMTSMQAHLAIAIIMAITYVVFDFFTPFSIKENVYQFVSQASFTAVLVYEILLKKKDRKSKK